LLGPLRTANLNNWATPVVEQNRVTLRLTVSQSVNMYWCLDHSGLVTRLCFPSEGFCPSLTRGRVCHLSVRTLSTYISCAYTDKRCLVKVKVTLQPTVSRSVCLGVRRPSGTRDQFFCLLEIFFRQLRVCYFVAPSLTRGLVCNLLLVLVLASAVPRDPRPYLICPNS
jgi:hypothetical protein